MGRSAAKALIKSGRVLLNGSAVRSSGEKADMSRDLLTVDGRKISRRKFVYIMMNKPKGVISSSDGRKTGEKTVLDILPPEMKRKGLFPAGRLDKNTTGFVLITDDGEFAHRILSPKNHIPKVYIAELDKPFTPEIAAAFAEGVEIGGEKCMPALLESDGDDRKRAIVTIKQGKYHQIKRMFKKYSIEVTELRRVKMGRLCLDENLAEGECRYLGQKEVEWIKSL